MNQETLRQLIVWNIGQGQWVTLVNGGACWHFDTGGEHAPWRALMSKCRERENILSFSHWDWDHISFAARLRQFLPHACVLLPPRGSTSPRKEKMMSALPKCTRPVPFESWVDENGRTANAKSRVIWWNDILIPGDSTVSEEKRWIHSIKSLRQTKILILGHHGSRTSTSRALLDRMPYLRAAIASARGKKYGHPHAKVRENLQTHHVPLLRTEEWGTLIFEL